VPGETLQPAQIAQGKEGKKFFPAEVLTISAGSNKPTGTDVSVPVEIFQPALMLRISVPVQINHPALMLFLRGKIGFFMPVLF
jgi:hypothetical protein